MKAPEVPVWALVHLTHAALQRIADEAGVDLLHIKGPAIRATLRLGIHDSTDADVLVRPAHIDRMAAALEAHSWELHTDFVEGSPFGHAANYRHPSWSYADVHRSIPGCHATDDESFDILWRDRETAFIAHHPCQVVSVPAQIALQAMHAARSHGHEKPESWLLCSDDVRPAVRALVAELQANTAFAAGIGELPQHRDAPDYALWHFWSSEGGDRLDEWVGKFRAARGTRQRLHVLRQALHVNRTHLRLRLEREPTRRDVAREQLERLRIAAASLRRHLRTRRKTQTTDAGGNESATAEAASTTALPTSGEVTTPSPAPTPVPPTNTALEPEGANTIPAPTLETVAAALPAPEPAIAITPVPENADPAAGPRLSIALDVAWLDATDAGRAEPVAWVARLETAELLELPDASWMVWTLIADGIGTVDGIRAEIAALGASVDFGEEGLDGFLAQLSASRLITTTGR